MSKPENESTAVAQTAAQPPAKTRPTVEQWLKGDDLLAKVSQALPKHVTPQYFMRVVFTACQKNNKLLQCTIESLFAALIKAAAHGIAPDGRRAYLIPYKDKCELVIGYQGFAELAFNTGKVSYITADVICDNDIYEENMGRVIQHRVNRKEPRGTAYAAYAMCQFKDGSQQFQIMSKEEILAIRDKSQGYRAFKAGYTKDNPWADAQAEPEMWKKTCFLRLKKWIPLSPEIRDVIESDDDVIDIPAPVQALPAPRLGKPAPAPALPSTQPAATLTPEEQRTQDFILHGAEGGES